VPSRRLTYLERLLPPLTKSWTQTVERLTYRALTRVWKPCRTATASGCVPGRRPR
jgi:hypothetical protein